MSKIDLINNGQANSAVGNQVISEGLNLNNRPFFDPETGRSWMTVHTGGDAADPKNYKTVPIQANAVLRRDEWKALDDALLRVSRENLTGIADLRANNLVYNMGGGMDSTVLESHRVGKSMEADLSMDGLSRSKGDRPTFDTVYTPLPIIHSDFEFNQRVLNNSRKLGNPIDTDGVEDATRAVTEKLEGLLFKDISYSFGNGTIYSYLNHPNKNAVNLATAWTDSSMDGAAILDDVLSLRKAVRDANKYGPLMLYIPSNYDALVEQDYDTTRGNTIRERLKMIQGIMDVKTAEFLPDDTVVMVEMTTSTVRLINATPIQTIQWKEQGGFVNKFKVMTIQVPQIRADKSGQCGVAVLS